MNHPVSDMLANSLAKIREMVDANTVVGDPIITPQGVTLIPVSKISCGYAGGGTDFVTKHSGAENPFGGGSGCSVKVTPVAFLVLKGENVRLLPVREDAGSALERLTDLLPELVDKLTAAIKKDDSIKPIDLTDEKKEDTVKPSEV